MLQQAAIAPTTMSNSPNSQPHILSTYGSESTPDPIAEAQSEKILPLKLPLLNFPKALFMNVLLFCPVNPGDIMSFASFTLMSSVAALRVLGEAGEPKGTSIKC